MKAAYTDKKHVRIIAAESDLVLVRELGSVVDKLPNGAKITEASVSDSGDLFLTLRLEVGEYNL